MRIVLAPLLICALCSNITFLTSSLAEGRPCAMECCAGLAPHAAGSCSHGAVQTGHVAHSDQEPTKGAVSSHCGTPIQAEEHPQESAEPPEKEEHHPAVIEVADRDLVHADHHVPPRSDHQKKPERTTGSISASAFSKPCEPSCGATVASPGGQYRPRDAAVLSHQARPRPPTVQTRQRFVYSPTKDLSAFGCRQGARAPPHFLLPTL